jgi:hypothetical protein
VTPPRRRDAAPNQGLSEHYGRVKVRRLFTFKTMDGKNAFKIDWTHPIVQAIALQAARISAA